jgi:site-specific DNA-cytosine methylase
MPQREYPFIIESLLRLIIASTTAYGSIKEVPGGADILIAGSSCVDFSNLNNKPPKTGESIVTFDAIRAYNRKFRPAIVVLENVKTAPWQKMQAVFEADGYFATFIHVDTKDYYLPQTRNRGYLVAFDDVRVMRAGIDPITLLAEFKSRMEYFRRPASSHALEFLLPQDDPRFQQARRDLESSRQDRKDVDWAKCKTRHSEYRDSTELGVQRPLTLWQNGGTCTPPDHFWIKWTKNQVERIWDVMDMNQLRSVHVGRDPQHVA